MACSNTSAVWMFGKKAFSTKVLNNSIDTRRFTYDESIRKLYRKKFDIEDKFVIGHVGRFDKDKNQKYLVEIFNQVYKKRDNSCLILVGDGILKSEIEFKVNELGLKSAVIFTGVRSDIPDLLQSFDCFVFPSIFEGLPVTVIEAQASGLKCILSDTITTEVRITELVEFMSLKRSPEDWADKILEYSNGYKRIDTSSQIRNEGYDVIENARWLEDFYLSVNSKNNQKESKN